MLVLIGLGGILGSLALLAGQGAYWLRFGEWPTLTGNTLLALNKMQSPIFAWGGVQKLADWSLALPLAVDLGVLGAIAVWIGTSIDET
jgi:hypothetical protein